MVKSRRFHTYLLGTSFVFLFFLSCFLVTNPVSKKDFSLSIPGKVIICGVCKDMNLSN